MNVNKQNPTHKRTETVNVNEHFLLKQLAEDKQLLSAWKELFNINAIDRKEIINEYITL